MCLSALSEGFERVWNDLVIKWKRSELLKARIFKNPDTDRELLVSARDQVVFLTALIQKLGFDRDQ